MENLIKAIRKTAGEKKKVRINKGGRPKVAHKKSEALSVMCNLLEKKIIQANARNVGKTVSVFLRDLGLHNRAAIRVRTLPKAVLQLTGTLNHIAANINSLLKSVIKEMISTGWKGLYLTKRSGACKRWLRKLKTPYHDW